MNQIIDKSQKQQHVQTEHSLHLVPAKHKIGYGRAMIERLPAYFLCPDLNTKPLNIMNWKGKYSIKSQKQQLTRPQHSLRSPSHHPPGSEVVKFPIALNLPNLHWRISPFIASSPQHLASRLHRCARWAD
jgi:hypothetical protein